MRNLTKKALLIFITMFFIFTFNLGYAFSADFISSDNSGNVNIGKSENLRNVFTAGNILKIEANIFKDLFTAGNNIEISGNVENDLWVAGSSIIVKGDVGGNIFAAGSNIQIDGKVDGDIICFSSSFTLNEKSIVNGNLYITAGVIDLKGNINKDINLNGGQVTLYGKIKGNVNINSSGIVKIVSTTVIDGNLKYNAKIEATIEEGSKILGKTEFTKDEITKRDMGKRRIFGLPFWMKMLIGIVTGIILVYLFGKITNPIIKESLTNFWSSLGIGFTGLFIAPIAIIFLFITMLGSYIGLMFGVIYVFFLTLSVAIAGITLGSLLLKIYKKETEYSNNWYSVIIGVIIISFAKLIPIIGWLPGFVFTLIGFGAAVKLLFQFLITKKTAQ